MIIICSEKEKEKLLSLFKVYDYCLLERTTKYCEDFSNGCDRCIEECISWNDINDFNNLIDTINNLLKEGFKYENK